MQTRLWLVFVLSASMVLGFTATPVTAADEATAKKYEQMIDKAVAFLGHQGAGGGRLVQRRGGAGGDGAGDDGRAPAWPLAGRSGGRQGPQVRRGLRSGRMAASMRRRRSTRTTKRASRSCASRKPTATASTTQS